MISLDHECAWTRRRRTEVFKCGGLLAGAGVQRSVFEHAAAATGTGITVAPDPEDEYGVKLILGDDEIALHDGCFFQIAKPNPRLERAVVNGVLQLHAMYLGCHSVPVDAEQMILNAIGDGFVVRLQSSPARGHLEVRRYAADASWISRLVAPAVRFRC